MPSGSISDLLLGRVEVVFQPDPVDYHTTDVVLIDGLRGPKDQPAGVADLGSVPAA